MDRVSRELDKQEAECNHEPFMHNTLNNRYECLCGKTSIRITDVCPSVACTCGRPKGSIQWERTTGPGTRAG